MGEHLRTVNYRRLVSIIYALLFAAFIVFAGVTFWQLRQEYDLLVQAETSARQRLAERHAALRENQRTLERLRTDPAFVELAIRRRLAYARPDEIVFRFESVDELLRSQPVSASETGQR